ncbi:MAG: 16S rRNA (guanine(966)-N(2))-methyltransferase RsmD [Flavobacteriales bacterium]|nr:16S rRNA (guanine(966)-N(2))-methyltransferase RsmD [Flavobacteriales bacterium]
MRIVGGKYRNRRLNPPGEMAARPTTDYAKEGLFNVLQHGHAIEGCRVLDLFAGTGNISLEFLSRGAASVLSVERDATLGRFMTRTATELGEQAWRQVKGDVFAFLKSHRGRYDIIFADPPFDLDGIATLPTLVFEAGLLEPDGLLIVEHSERMDLSTLPGYQRTRKYGTIHFSFFQLPAEPETSAP